jgi:Tfp pilus assembly protein PilF
VAPEHSQNRIRFIISIGIVIASLVAYEPIRRNGFVDYDDPRYITENPNVTGGITRDSIIWAFTKLYAANWHPLTWLSHMVDCQLFGLNPVGHHITNLLIHVVNSLLLFLLLWKTTAAIWRSAFVAAAFALHPIHVESVAWAAERKDVLSGLFWMLTILAYVHYVKRPNVGRYMLVILAFVMGLMSKPMVVTLPFVLLLLDYWPLQRNPQDTRSAETGPFRKPGGLPRWLVIEKIPLFVLSAASCVITFIAQKNSQAVVTLTNWPLYVRIINALSCYYNYVAQMLYPKGLAVLYPAPDRLFINSAAAAVMGVVVLLVLWGRGRRWLVMGLLWYLGTLVPVIGLVQVGAQIMADRYTYIPSIGVFIIIAWGAEEIFSKKHLPKAVLASAAAIVIVAMVLTTRVQTGYWQDTATLFKRAITVTKNNYTMLNNYGAYLCAQGNFEEGLRYSEEALRIYPNFIPAQSNICAGLLAQKKVDDAISCYNETLQRAKDLPDAYKLHFGLGLAYVRKGNLDLAEINFKKALTLRPDFVPAQNGLASVLARKGRMNKPLMTK